MNCQARCNNETVKEFAASVDTESVPELTVHVDAEPMTELEVPVRIQRPKLNLLFLLMQNQ